MVAAVGCLSKIDQSGTGSGELDQKKLTTELQQKYGVVPSDY
jgi:hypothetical protein